MTEPHTCCCRDVHATLQQVTSQLTELMHRPIEVDGVALERAMDKRIVKAIDKSKRNDRRR